MLLYTEYTNHAKTRHRLAGLTRDYHGINTGYSQVKHRLPFCSFSREAETFQHQRSYQRVRDPVTQGHGPVSSYIYRGGGLPHLPSTTFSVSIFLSLSNHASVVPVRVVRGGFINMRHSRGKARTQI
jgi:hypothetical protein